MFNEMGTTLGFATAVGLVVGIIVGVVTSSIFIGALSAAVAIFVVALLRGGTASRRL